MTPCIGPYSPVEAIAKSVLNTSVRPTDHLAGRGPVRHLRRSSELRTAVSTQADGRSAADRRISYARWYANSLDAPGWSA
jgi:hypothetical protein